MRYKRTFASIVVAALVALTGFAGGVTAAPVAQEQPVQQTQQMEDAELNVSEMVVENLSTSMEIGSATIEMETEDGTQEVTVDSATVELTNATVEVYNASIADGALQLGEATVMITDGTVEIESSQGDRSIDLSDTEMTAEDETITLEDVTDEVEMTEEMQDATISEMTVDGISGTASHDLLVVNLDATETTNDQNVSVVVQNGNLEVEDASVTLMDATIEGDTLQAGSVEANVSMATFEAERVVTLYGSDLGDQSNVSATVQDRTVSQSDVEFSMTDLSELLEQLMGDEAAAAIAS